MTNRIKLEPGSDDHDPGPHHLQPGYKLEPVPPHLQEHDERDDPALEKLQKLIEVHDLTYSYSDDMQSFAAGLRQYCEIIHEARQLHSQKRVYEMWVDKCRKTLSIQSDQERYANLFAKDIAKSTTPRE